MAVTSVQPFVRRLDEAKQVSGCLAAEELNLDHKIAECKAQLVELSSAS